MTPDDPRMPRIDELLADRALQGLSVAEAAELAGLAADPDAEGLALELAAAAAELALGGDDDRELPASLRRRLEADADAFFADARPAPAPALAPMRIAARAIPWLGWVAAAAAVLFAVQVRREPANPRRPAPEPTPVERLSGVPSRPLSNTGHPLARGGSGTLVWSGDRQEGYLALRGLAETVPGRGVYQLWIFDATRDDRFPVDGGTFTIADAGSTTLVPFRPRVEVRRPTLFAVTLEPPGGVVVSDRKRLLLTAAFPP
jgi:anti-sigma-K factor RskA